MTHSPEALRALADRLEAEVVCNQDAWKQGTERYIGLMLLEDIAVAATALRSLASASDGGMETTASERSTQLRNLEEREYGNSSEARLLRDFDRLSATNARLTERVKVLEEALEPFSEIARWDIGASESDEDFYRPMSLDHAYACPVTVGHLRRARSVLSNKTDPASLPKAEEPND